MPFCVISSKVLKFVICVIASAIILTLNIFGSPLASVFFAKIDRRLPIYAVATDEKKVAISFDAAWGADKTEGIIELLNEFEVKATFFLVGFWVDEYPDKVKEIDDAGYEIGTHSNTHPDMAKLSVGEMQEELSLSVSKIESITHKKVRLFRPPFGSYNDNLIQVADSMGLKTIQWDVDSLDWKGGSATQIANLVAKKVKNGSIILMHNNSDNILGGLRLILEHLKQKGYDVTNIGNLVYESDYTINNQGIQQAI